ncbi:filamentous hemagglutinin family protein [Variovorax paradoxus]|uniref:two-partner secretion domain-containing protein n=1 Tax=Variovorax atrisoli TaxID=3394203 RepID=UPI00119C883E|nr:filamentous hemagglutinin N-terminal domain-containing protein [Variovorax paradoxus]MDR6521266.1 filamentous hemagglutinin family protein [Variovorax paradoxus]
MKQRNPSSRAPVRRLQLRPIALSLICAGAAPAMAQVLPTGFTPLAGNVTMSQAANVMTINQGLARGIVNWTSFSIGVGGVVNVVQPGASSVLLNRVTGNELSTIAGQLNANGRIVLVNPAGVLFSQGSTVHVGGIIASTLAMTTSEADFLNPATTKFSFERADASTASVINNGRITATGGGPVVLMGATVANARIGSDDDSGRITADGGTVALASGRKITLDLAGDGLTNIVIATDAMATHASVSNSGTLQADGGHVALVGRSATVGELVVNQRGTVRARSVGTRNGEIFLGGGEDNEMQLTGGTLDATGAAAGERGGDIRVLGGKVTVQGLADGTKGVADASGQAGGGSVTVQGYDVALSPNAVLRADGTGTGAGGTISVGTATGAAFAGDAANPLPERESHVQVFGELTARGASSAAGGSITTSGDFVRIDPARVDAAGGAQGGANGRWTVSTGNNLTVDADADMPAYDGAYPSLSFSDVSARAVGATLGRGTDVTLSSTRTGDSAGVTFGNDAQVVKNEGGSATLRVDSAGGIAMNSGSAIDARVGALNVDFNADSTGLVAKNAAQVNVGGGNPSFELDYGASIIMSGATIDANGGNIRFFGQGDANNGRAVGGSLSHSELTWSDGIFLSNSTLATSGAGQVSLRGQGRTRVDSQDSDTNFVYVGTSGVSLQDSAVQGGSGGVSIDGLASLGGDGVRLSNGTKVSTPGNVTVTGRGVDWTDNTLPAGSIDTTTAVNIDSSSIEAGGDVRIEGTGANLQALTKYLQFAANGRTAGGGNGVALSGSVSAGDGRRIDIVGKAGSAGFTAALDGGGAVVTTPTGIPVYGVAVSADSSQPNPLRTAGGTIALDAQGTDISLRMNTFGSGLGAAPDGAMLSVASSTGQGGHISLTGRNVLVEGSQNFDGTVLPATLDAGGATGGGSIDITASNVIALGSNSSLDASAGSAGGNGGTINVISGDTLRAYGSISARGAGAGNGGKIETSAPHFALAGLRVDASAQAGSAGQAGTWTIDPYNVTIAHGTASGSLTGDPFVPIANSTVQDGDINAALDKGTSVTITTGTGGLATDGNISFDTLAAIQRTTGGAPVTFQLDAAHNISGSGATNSIQSTGGALNVVFNAGVGGQGGAISYNGSIATNGGDVTMNAAAGASSGSAISLNSTTIDTRTTAGDAGPGGSVSITGTRSLPTTIVNTVPTVDLTGVTITSSTGDVTISGIGQHGDGVRIQNGTAPSQILTTSGDISIAGVGASYTYSLSPLSVQSVDITGATVIRSVDGNIGIRGLVTPGPLDAPSGGVLVGGTTLVTTLGLGSIDIAGESQANGTGLTVAAGARVSGNNNVVLRASNNGSSDALVLAGNVRAGNVLNLRPGGVDAAGNAVDRTANPITLGGTAANGFAVSADEFTRLDAPTIVAGSNAHAGNIAVVGPLTLPGALTLQNGGGGGIQLGGAITASTVGLVSAGDITQTAAAPITAGTLLARSTGGSVLLDQAANNVSADTLGGGAAGAFRYVDVDTVKLGPVSVTGYDAAGNAPQLVSATSMAANTVAVRTLTGDLLLGTDVSSTGGVDLVAGSRFQNTGSYGITGAPWRVWANTWVGETRGGLAGSGLYPNLYHCAYSGLCAVSIPAGANHFIYAQQPVATVVIGNASRPFGFPNPLFSYGIGGLILGDTGAGFAGFMFSPALQTSPPGVYPINGSFTSAEGYAVNVVPGNLFVNQMPDLPRPDALRDLPATWVYDRNIGPPPICFATGPLDGDRASQGGDVLAREWSRVRSRPNLSSCVDTEKRNGCADF